MSLLLPNGTVELQRPDAPDDHGWSSETWTTVDAAVPCSLQPSVGNGNPLASGSGGSGPGDPLVTQYAEAYFDVGVTVYQGDRIVDQDGQSWNVASQAVVRGPTSDLDCVRASCLAVFE